MFCSAEQMSGSSMNRTNLFLGGFRTSNS